MSAQKQKGTMAETAVVRYLQDNGISARRNPLMGTKDEGDILISGKPSITVEVKNHRTMALATWVDEAAVEKANAGTDLGIVIHKRLRKGNPGDYYVTMTVDELIALLKYGTIKE